ncbi:PIN domain-containing protein [Candidatus Uhrbacteria bacterium]|nr:PIN domain-containing protein [Candidatus Uhrbacteria bacterium]
MTFVDTNYFLRLLIADVETHHKIARSLFDSAAQAKVKLFTSVIVFFEVSWVLSSFYNKRKTELLSLLEDILNLEFIDIEERPILEEALRMFRARTIELEDAYNIVYARTHGAKHFATFDKKLAKSW